MTPTAIDRPAHPAGLVAFRIAFGLVMAVAAARFVARGWLDTIYREPSFHFTWRGLDWIRPWPGWGLELHYAVMGGAALALALGWRPRLAAAVYGLLFTYAELIEKAAYLNHYYLVSLLAFALVFIPSDGRVVPLGAYLWLRVQVGVVYVYAGLAKLDADWLLRAEPLRTWLGAFTDLPVVGPLMGEPWVAYAFAWGGALFDLTVVPLLLWRRTRRFAYAAAVVFHLTIWALFPVGVFSPLMLVAATVFFDPAWAGRWIQPRGTPVGPPPRWLVGFAAGWLALQALLPLRGHLHEGTLAWHEAGFRFAWRVMLMEKVGAAEFRVCDAEGRCDRVFPGRELAPFQVKMMATQPDMILQYAHHLAEGRDRRVYADVWVSLNGRPSQRLIDPTLDLTTISRATPASEWVLPLAP